jgi:hypothetical protein
VGHDAVGHRLFDKALNGVIGLAHAAAFQSICLLDVSSSLAANCSNELRIQQVENDSGEALLIY